jgi:hypothetical protein
VRSAAIRNSKTRRRNIDGSEAMQSVCTIYNGRAKYSVE